MKQKTSLCFATSQHPEEAHAGNGIIPMPLRRGRPATHGCPLLEKILKVRHVLGKPLAVQLLPDVLVGVPPRPLCLQPHARPWTQLKATTHMDTLRGHWSPRYHKERRPPILCSISQAVMRHSSLPVLPTSTACANALTESCRFTPGMDAYPHSLRQDATKLLIAVLLHSQGSADGRQALLLNQLHQGCLRRQPGAIQPMPSSLLVGTSNY